MGDGKELYSLITTLKKGKGSQSRIEELLKSTESLWHAPEEDDPILHQAVVFDFKGDEFAKLLRNLINHVPDVVNKENANGYTPLHLAVEGNKYELATLLVQNHADVNKKTAFVLGLKEPTEDDTAPEEHNTSPEKHDTALHLAARFQSVKCLELLLENKADVNATNMLKETALHIAVAGKGADNLACVELLIKYKADLKKTDLHSFTPLHVAAVTGSKDIVKLLCDGGADPEEKTKRGWTPLHLAAYENNSQVINELMDFMKTPTILNEDDQTALHVAVKIKYDYTTSVVELLQNEQYGKSEFVNKKSFVNMQDGKGKTALHLAIEHGNLNIVQELLNIGADKDIKDMDGSTPLHITLQYKHPNPASYEDTNFIDECIKKLVFKKTKLSSNKKGETPLHIAAMNNYYQYIAELGNSSDHFNAKDNNEMTPLHIATQKGFMSFVQELAKKADVNAIDKYGRTSLYIAVEASQKDCAEILLQTGHDLEIKANNEMTALHKAVMNKDGAAFVRLLIKHGADVNADAKDGWKPIHIAAFEGNLKCLESLLEAKVSIDATIPSSGFSAFHLAAQNGHIACLKHLHKKNANINLKTSYGSDGLSLAKEYKKEMCIEFLEIIHKDPTVIYTQGTNIHETKDTSVTTKTQQNIKKWQDITVDSPAQFVPEISVPKKGRTRVKGQDKKDRKYIEDLIANNNNVNSKDSDNKTIFHLAAEVGLRDILEDLIQKGANLKIKDETNSTTLHIAARNGRKECVELLLKKFEDSNCNYTYLINLPNDKDSTALHLAVENDHYECVKLLVHSKADIHKENNEKRSVLQIATERGQEKTLEYLMDQIPPESKVAIATKLLFRAAKNGRASCISILLANKADINARNNENMTAMHLSMEKQHGECLILLLKACQSDQQNLRMLHYAAKQGYSDMMNVLIRGLKIKVDGKDEDGLTALHTAAFFGHTACLKPLVKKIENIDLKDNNTFTALHYAAREGKVECLKELINNGADVNSGNEKGATPLHMAARDERIDCLKILLENLKINVDSQTKEKWTPLHYASQNGHELCVEMLLEKGADVNMATGWGYTSLRFAAANNHLKCVEILLQQKYGIEVNKKCDKNRTALHLASMNGHVECVKRLISANASVNEKDEFNNTPLHFVARKQNKEYGEILELLLQTPNVEVDSRDEKGCTPLLAAAQGRHLNNMEILVKHNANLNIASQVQQLYTPLHEVVSRNHEACTKFLIEHGADLAAIDNTGLTPLQLASKRGYKALKDILTTHAEQNIHPH